MVYAQKSVDDRRSAGEKDEKGEAERTTRTFEMITVVKGEV